MSTRGDCIGGPGDPRPDAPGDPTRGIQLALDLVADIADDRWHAVPMVARDRARQALALLPAAEMRALRAACELMRDVARDYGAMTRPEGAP